MNDEEIKERLDAKAIRQVELKDQIISQHRAEVKKRSDARVAAGMRPIGIA